MPPADYLIKSGTLNPEPETLEVEAFLAECLALLPEAAGRSGGGGGVEALGFLGGLVVVWGFRVWGSRGT